MNKQSYLHCTRETPSSLIGMVHVDNRPIVTVLSASKVLHWLVIFWEVVHFLSFSRAIDKLYLYSLIRRDSKDSCVEMTSSKVDNIIVFQLLLN
jgi:hypothetical protein